MFYVDRRIEVRYAETDMMGVVYHGNYPTWMELGRTAFAAKLGYDYKDMEADGLQAPVRNINITYNVPVKYGDDVFIRTWLKKCTPFRSIYRSLVFNNEGTVCMDAESQSVCVHKDTFQLASFKKYCPAWYESYQTISVGEDEAPIYEQTAFHNI
jgi:acyl-CoA thioester hydrolase